MDQNSEPSKVVFGDEKFQRPTKSLQTQTPKIIEWVVRYSGGYVKDKKQASYVLLAFAVLTIVISFLIIPKQNPRKLGPEEKNFLDQKKSTESYDIELFSQ